MKKNIEGITEKLEQGMKDLLNSENWKAYLKTMSRFHKYSFGNCILITMQFPEASRVAGYKTWQSLGRQVRKGEKAISILAPCPHKKRIEVTKEDGTKDEKEIVYTTYRAVPVFDISQTDGKDLPEICTTLAGGVQGFTRLREVLSSISPVPVTEGDARGANGFYSRSEKRIVIQQGMSEAQTIKTTVHEIAHSMMHSGSGKSPETEEVEAESVAFTVCNYFGYLAGWSDGDIDVLSKSLAAIQKTAHSIIEGIEKGLAA